MATRPTVGQDAPAFSLATQDGTTVSLTDFHGSKAVVLYFYPKDDTPGCTTESCAFRDLKGDFESVGAVILGVSRDDTESHGKFASKFGLNFPLLADTEGTVCNAYGVWVEKNNYGKKYMGIERTTFVIGKDGKVASVFARVKVEGHAEAVLEAVRALG